MKRITLAEWNDELIAALRRVGWLKPREDGRVFGRVFVELKEPERKRGGALRVNISDPEMKQQPKYQQQLVKTLVEGLKWKRGNAHTWVALTMEMTPPGARWTSLIGRPRSDTSKAEAEIREVEATGQGRYGFVKELKTRVDVKKTSLGVSEKTIRRRGLVPPTIPKELEPVILEVNRDLNLEPKDWVKEVRQRAANRAIGLGKLTNATLLKQRRERVFKRSRRTGKFEARLRAKPKKATG